MTSFNMFILYLAMSIGECGHCPTRTLLPSFRIPVCIPSTCGRSRRIRPVAAEWASILRQRRRKSTRVFKFRREAILVADTSFVCLQTSNKLAGHGDKQKLMGKTCVTSCMQCTIYSMYYYSTWCVGDLAADLEGSGRGDWLDEQVVLTWTMNNIALFEDRLAVCE